MFLRQTYIEIRKTLAHPALWLGLAGLSLLLAAFVVILHLQITRGFQPIQGGLEQDLIDGLVFFGWVGSLVYGVCAAVIVAFDYPDRSLQLWLARGLPRPTLLLARLAVVLLIGLALVLYTVIACLGMAAVSRLFFFGQVDASRMNWAFLLPAALRVYWTALPYLALGVFLAVVSRSPVFSAVGTVIYAAVLEPLLPSLLRMLTGDSSALLFYLPGQLARVLQEQLMGLSLAASAPSAPAMPETQAALLIALITLALAGASMAVFARQDLGG